MALATLVTTAALLAAAAPAQTRPPLIDHADPCRCNPVLVNWGHSRGGQEWHERFGVRGSQNFLVVSLPSAGVDDGGAASWTGNALGRMVYTVDYATGFANPDPTVVGGVASARVHSIRFLFGDRPPVTVHPRAASRRLRHRFPFLRRMRFYMTWLDTGGDALLQATAYDSAGSVLRTDSYR